MALLVLLGPWPGVCCSGSLAGGHGFVPYYVIKQGTSWTACPARSDKVPSRWPEATPWKPHSAWRSVPFPGVLQAAQPCPRAGRLRSRPLAAPWPLTRHFSCAVSSTPHAEWRQRGPEGRRTGPRLSPTLSKEWGGWGGVGVQGWCPCHSRPQRPGLAPRAVF